MNVLFALSKSLIFRWTFKTWKMRNFDFKFIKRYIKKVIIVGLHKYMHYLQGNKINPFLYKIEKKVQATETNNILLACIGRKRSFPYFLLFFIIHLILHVNTKLKFVEPKGSLPFFSILILNKNFTK